MTTEPDGPASGRATITLFCGLPGSGKTTLARRLESQGRGVRICTDEWQFALGVPPDDDDFHERLQVTLYQHALGLLRVGCDVILEDGLWRAEERAAIRSDDTVVHHASTQSLIAARGLRVEGRRGGQRVGQRGGRAGL